ncbi:tRNA pseudouridine(38-40) synthase TruA [Pseudanabaena sp. FACHB-1998]|uniref:tRNA pseudouridine(38-40) synthase TruA n=1 Tax=Pseudanabaena sp. FACHB-1998 TaxID=2692858 RepID=UPI0016803FE1|nr:tRNA pseudouridine(38-40) synthase TruA [Pseudanabaena sp. FACHB-1998]MBD2178498.1 tRNA pseudouridine(38-40) synthase TruA [Pseudanabaena sp. FACHB-1998]
MIFAVDPQSSQRVALVIQYLGTHYYGWQRQPNHPSVQQTIEEAIAKICGKPTVVHSAGRTDTGVHAAAQVAHFDTPSMIPPHRWAKVLNTYLPDDILICGSSKVPSDWHSRFSATWRRYRYTIYTAAIPNLFVKQFSWHYYHDRLDEQLIHEALQPMLGEQDMAAFQRAGSSRPHSRLELQEAQCWREGDFVHVEVQASGFLYGMIRLLVGQLIDVGCHRLSIEAFTSRWKDKRRIEVKYAAPPQGLCLLAIGYADNPFAEFASCKQTLSLLDNQAISLI